MGTSSLSSFCSAQEKRQTGKKHIIVQRRDACIMLWKHREGTVTEGIRKGFKRLRGSLGVPRQIGGGMGPRKHGQE